MLGDASPSLALLGTVHLICHEGGRILTKGKIALVLLVVVIVIIAPIFFHSTPTLALRTSVFFHGYPIVAITTNIHEYEPYSQQDKERIENENARLYKLSQPPIEKVTNGYL